MDIESNVSAVYKMILLQIYPVGTIYESLINNDPSNFIGGKWARLGKGRIFIGAGNTYQLGDEGGESEHMLTTSEIPSHNHTVGLNSHDAKSTNKFWDTAGLCYGDSTQYSVDTGLSGESTPHENMPPYTVICSWERVE